ncbi:MAG: hypothetical protein V4547_09025 [Bacteroidota bacterium]
MEITNEIKAKIFAQYLGQKIQWRDTSETEVTTLTISELDRSEKITFLCIKLLLKPLFAISDEDALAISVIMQFTELEEETTKIEYIKQVIPNLYPCSSCSKLIVLNVFQFLQSKGYDLPQYLLGGKTLFESGLAIYK